MSGSCQRDSGQLAERQLVLNARSVPLPVLQPVTRGGKGQPNGLPLACAPSVRDSLATYHTGVAG
jgi:hypothetical protein